MATCIICRSVKEQFNREHVIPYAVGGKLVIDKVCKDCNNLLGTEIDCHLTNLPFIEMKRFELGVEGRTGYIPDPWIGPATLGKEGSTKVILKRTKDGKLYSSPLITFDVDGSNPFKIKMTGPISEFEKGMSRKLDRFLKSINATRESLTNEKITKSPALKSVAVTKSFETNLSRVYLAVLKIAYEFTIFVIPEYFTDDRAVEISRRILNYSNDEDYSPSFLMSKGFSEIYEHDISNIFEFSKDHHYLILLQLKYGLLCHVSIFGLNFYILVSQKHYFSVSEMLALKNDVRADKAIIYTFDELKWHVENEKKIR